jgi:hypothetical protein
MKGNLERIDGAKEIGIHPVADGETHGGVPAGGRETPAARRAARARGGARLADRRLSHPESPQSPQSEALLEMPIEQVEMLGCHVQHVPELDKIYKYTYGGNQILIISYGKKTKTYYDKGIFAMLSSSYGDCMCSRNSNFMC